ncbi:MAG: GDP-mannose 4,6-dehydratase [Chitinophagaceae bacterium]|nr:GDP-mannose 4,6-dehydratase [Chitinophagaceae bacterium]
MIIRNLSVKKEFGFAGDIVKAVWKLINQDVIFETTIGTGKSYSIKEWVEYCFKSLGLDFEEYVLNENIDPEYWTLVSNPTTIMSLGWEPVDFIPKLMAI